MIVQIYGVKILPNGEKERRYYGDVEYEDAQNRLELAVITGCDYAYAKQIGVGTLLTWPRYRETTCRSQEEQQQRQQANQDHPS